MAYRCAFVAIGKALPSAQSIGYLKVAIEVEVYRES
jgi:hypothetical protein